MNQHITHVNDIAPRRFGMFLSEFFGKHIGCFSDNHNIINHCMKTHFIGLHFLKSLPFKEIHHMANAFLNVIKTFNIPNSLSHRLVSYHD